MINLLFFQILRAFLGIFRFNSNLRYGNLLNEANSSKEEFDLYKDMCCKLVPKINQSILCEYTLKDMSVFAISFTTKIGNINSPYVLALIGIGLHVHGMKYPEILRFRYHESYNHIICVFISLLLTLLLVSSVAFAIGIQKDLPQLFIPWICLYCILTVFLVLHLIYLIITRLFLPDLLLGILATINIFIILIACNFYEETRLRVEQEGDRPRTHRTTYSSPRYSDFIS